jgi:undecaprenyl-diphosphatase
MRNYLQRRFPRVFGWIFSADLLELLAVLAVVGGSYAFIELADKVSEGSTARFDESIMRALRRADDPEKPIGPEWTGEIGRDLTALGGIALLVIVTVAVLVYLLIRRLYHAALLVFLATLGGLILNVSLKGWVDRARPDVVPHLSSYVATSSFPSGHSMLSATIYLTLGALLARFVAEYRLKVYFFSLALLLTVLVGFSRVFLGVHYPTDVLGGWTAGLVWALLCWLIARYLQRRGAVEQVNEEEEAEDAAERSAEMSGINPPAAPPAPGAG